MITLALKLYRGAHRARCAIQDFCRICDWADLKYYGPGIAADTVTAVLAVQKAAEFVRGLG